MSAMQRRKGRAFEQRIARKLRSIWPEATIRRASQADQAHQSDVYIDGGPPLLSWLWLECQDARKPTPEVKLAQAERDIGTRVGRLPVVIWHKLNERDINVTTRLWVLDRLMGSVSLAGQEVVTLAMDQFVQLVDKSARYRQGQSGGAA